MNRKFDFIDKYKVTPEKYCQNVGGESRKTWMEKFNSGFFEKYMYSNGLDVGGTGYEKNVHAILPEAIIVDLDYPGYDGHTLPFKDNTQHYVYSSHCLEHIENYKKAIQEWYRVTKIGGCIITVVPHRDLYELRENPPSQWNLDHKRFYKTSDLIREFEESLSVNSFRVRHLRDNDNGHKYNRDPKNHADGDYEIEIVVEKLK